MLGPDREREEQETRNANALMQFVGEYMKNNPDALLTEPLLLQFHEILTAGINYEYNEPGRYRSHAVNVGAYRPPSTQEEVRDLMTAFFTWFNTGLANTWDPVLRAIIAHFYVVSIHPFGDGNGRTSRAVESFLLYKAGVNVRGYYSLANYYYQHRDEYIYHLNDIQMRGGSDLTPFASFALTDWCKSFRLFITKCWRRLGYWPFETMRAAPWPTPASWAIRRARGNCSYLPSWLADRSL